MAYDRRTAGNGPGTIGYGGDVIDLSGGDFTVTSDVKHIACVAAGNVVYRAMNGLADIPVTGMPVMGTLPHHALVIRQTGTTATLVTVKG